MEYIEINYLIPWICIIGLCLGSFYNVVILRSLTNESIVFPASKCPKCGKSLKAWHNIPVVSYLLLQGKCAFCKEKISIQYPIIELTTMLLFLASLLKFGISWKTLFAIIFCSCMLIMSMTDIKEKLVDCTIAIGLAIVGILSNWLINANILDSIFGLVAGILIMECLALTGYLFTKSRAFGEADTYVAGALGACFGLIGLIHILLYTLISAMLFIIPMFLYKQFKNNNKQICILSILFILSILLYKTITQNIYTLLPLLGIGTGLIISILKSMKKNSELTYLPLVPAFAIASLYFLFF